ncbi:MAG: hypothetical protein AAB926_01530 [Patescibacteria group bacterium]
MAAAIAKAIPESEIFFVPANVLGPEALKTEIRLRLRILQAEGVSRSRISFLRVGISSTFGEAWEVLSYVLGTIRRHYGGHVNVMVIADWPHTRRAKKIFELIFERAMNVEVLARSVEGEWDGNHPAVKSSRSWLIGNILHYLLVLVLGEKAERFQRKYKK